jgi:hypothetical protein
VTVAAILSQYVVPYLVPATRPLYGNLAGGILVVYGVPIAAFALLVGPEPLERFASSMGKASVEGLRWYGALSLAGLLVAVVVLAVLGAVDPAAVHQITTQTNPELTQAKADPWFWVLFSFAIGALEETIFRGWIFGAWLARSGSDWVGPAVGSSAIFAGVHLYYGATYGVGSAVYYPELFLLGFAFAAVYRYSGGNLVVVALLHGANDSAAFLTLVSPGGALALHYGLILVGGAVALAIYLRSLSPPAPPPFAPWAGPWPPGSSPNPPPVAWAPPPPPPPVARSARPAGASGSSSARPSAPAMGPSDERVRAILASARTIAVVGLSDKLERDSNEVARYLQAQGYRVVPVNPMLPEVLGERSYPSVAAIPADVKVDIVDIFRRSDQVPPIVLEAVQRGVPTVWMQLGVTHDGASATARAAGATVVEDRCIMQEHRRLGRHGRPA